MNQTQTPDANSFLQFWIIILFVGQIATVLVGVINGFANRKQRREVTFPEELTPRREFDQHVKEFSACKAQCLLSNQRVQSELREDRHSNEVHASERSKTLFTKLEANRKELDDKIESTRRELSEKIDEMPERVIATLKNTGAI
jgi:hypothetical protein